VPDHRHRAHWVEGLFAFTISHYIGRWQVLPTDRRDANRADRQILASVWRRHGASRRARGQGVHGPARAVRHVPTYPLNSCNYGTAQPTWARGTWTYPYSAPRPTYLVRLLLCVYYTVRHVPHILSESSNSIHHAAPFQEPSQDSLVGTWTRRVALLYSERGLDDMNCGIHPIAVAVSTVKRPGNSDMKSSPTVYIRSRDKLFSGILHNIRPTTVRNCPARRRPGRKRPYHALEVCCWTRSRHSGRPFRGESRFSYH
jgi:hypothetical protein